MSNTNQKGAFYSSGASLQIVIPFISLIIAYIAIARGFMMLSNTPHSDNIVGAILICVLVPITACFPILIKYVCR